MTSSMPEVAENTWLVRASTTISSELHDGVVMLDIEAGKYFGADEVGYRIWQLLVSPIQMREIVAVLIEEYDVEQSRCEVEVAGFIGSLLDAGLVEARDRCGN